MQTHCKQQKLSAVYKSLFDISLVYLFYSEKLPQTNALHFSNRCSQTIVNHSVQKCPDISASHLLPASVKDECNKKAAHLRYFILNLSAYWKCDWFSYHSRLYRSPINFHTQEISLKANAGLTKHHYTVQTTWGFAWSVRIPYQTL